MENRWAIMDDKSIIYSNSYIEDVRTMYVKATHYGEEWKDYFPNEDIEDIKRQLENAGLVNWIGDLKLIEIHEAYK
jgi:hypothetical protein